MKITYLRIPDTNIIYQYTRYASGNCVCKMIFDGQLPRFERNRKITAAEYRDAMNNHIIVGGDAE